MKFAGINNRLGKKPAFCDVEFMCITVLLLSEGSFGEIAVFFPGNANDNNRND